MNKANIYRKFMVAYTDTWQIFGPTIEYIATHRVLTENVSMT